MQDNVIVVDGVAFVWTRDDDRLIMQYARERGLWDPEAMTATNATTTTTTLPPVARTLFGESRAPTTTTTSTSTMSDEELFAPWQALVQRFEAQQQQRRDARVLSMRAERVIELLTAKAAAHKAASTN